MCRADIRNKRAVCAIRLVGVIATDPTHSLNKTFSCNARRKLGSLDVEVMSGVSAELLGICAFAPAPLAPEGSFVTFTLGTEVI